MSRTFEIPTIVTVTVQVDDDGTTKVLDASVGGEAPWVGSDDPVAWEPATEQWHEDWGDDTIEKAWAAAPDIWVSITDQTAEIARLRAALQSIADEKPYGSDRVEKIARRARAALNPT